MDYIKKQISGYNLHMIKDDKFRTITTDLIFRGKATKEEITKRNFLADMLTYSCKNYKTRREMALHEQDLYASIVDFNCYRLGNSYNTEITLLGLNDKYAEKGMFEKEISFLSDVIFNPNVCNNQFDNNSFERVKKNSEIQMDHILEDARKYSMIKMLEKMGKDEAYSLHGYGYREELDKITPSNLYEFYLDFIRNSPLDIFVVGNIDFDETEAIFKKYFKLDIFHRKEQDIMINHKKIRKRSQTFIEPYSSSQAKLSIGCKVKDLTPFERDYALVIFNLILGGDTDSRLFRNVREQNSLCYYINSVSNKIDNVLFITSGINKDNFKKTISLIKKELTNIKNGKVTEQELDKAITRYISLIEEASDYPDQIISYYYANCLFGSDLPEERVKRVKEVTLENIISVANKISIDTIYLLGGDIDA